MSQFEPESYGKYYLVDKIAVGGMAEIFKAKTFSTAGFEKVQVIKRILSHLSDNEEFVSMFIDEAKISVSLQHANIVQIYDFGKLHDNYFIAMECVDGKDVKQILRKLAERRKLMPEEFAVFIAHEVTKGLEYAHHKTNMHGNPLGIVHRDMSPSNVLVGYGAEVKIADFGIAKAEMSQYNTKDGVLKGKFEYMSPEQARGEDVSNQSDIFSAGIILYEMLTGRRLFKTDSEIKTLEKIKAVDIEPPSSMNPNIPARLDGIVMRALTADIEQRYPDARAFQQALLEYMYPSTPPVIQRSLAMFMEQLFEEERAGELERLTSGSLIATQLYEQDMATPAPEQDWGEGSSAATLRSQEPNRIPLYAAIAIVLLLLGVVAFLATRGPERQEVVREVAVAPTEGAVDLKMRPPTTKVFRGTQLLGQGAVVNLNNLEPGQLTLRFEADGYETREEVIELAAGERVVYPVALTEIEVEPEPDLTPAPRDTPPPPQNDGATDSAKTASVRFTSTPSGAQVLVDNTVVGDTPMSWTGSVGSTHSVVFKLNGYSNASGSVTVEDAGSALSKTLQKQVAAKGKVSINLTGRGWADIYVDGKNIGRTPKFNYELSAGSHTIKLVNEAAGLDISKTVTVTAGETTKVIFSP